MPHLFGTLIFNSSWNSGAIDWGWSEVYPLRAGDYSSGADALQALAAARLPMMCADTSLVGSRLSDGDVRGDSFPTGVALGPGTYTVSGKLTYRPEVVLRFLQRNDPLQRANRWVRAIPDDQFNALGNYAPTAGYILLVGTYVNAITANVDIAKRIGTFPTTPAWSFTPVTSVDGAFVDKRQYGRPFGLPRGRRLAG